MASVGKNLRKPDDENGSTEPDTSSEADISEGADIGDALRSAYEEAVSEDIPGELLDLLGKLN